MKDKGIASEVGAAIAVLRKRQRLTQAQVAESMNVEKETVSRIETGVISPSLARLRQIADVLGCTPADLFRPGSPDALDQAHKIVELLQGLDENERAMVVRVVGEVAGALRQRPCKEV